MNNFPLNFIDFWENENSFFSIETSGSTGNPKRIDLKKEWLIWSANQSSKILNINSISKIYCCLPLSKIGGFMQLVRAKVWKKEIEITKPKSNPLLNYDGNADFISITPHQLDNVLKNELSYQKLCQFKIVLIGGSDINQILVGKLKEFKQTAFYHTYGMTETGSHIALKKLNYELYFKKFEDVELKLNDENELLIKLPFFNEFLKTNDLAKLINYNEFEILGRSDFIINTGGVKINPEKVENLIYLNLKIDFDILVSSVKDTNLGEKTVLYIPQNEHVNISDLSFLDSEYKFSKPFQIIKTKFPLKNEFGKPNRKFFLTENQ